MTSLRAEFFLLDVYAQHNHYLFFRNCHHGSSVWTLVQNTPSFRLSHGEPHRWLTHPI